MLYVQKQYISNQKESSETERIWGFLVYLGKGNQILKFPYDGMVFYTSFSIFLGGRGGEGNLVTLCPIVQFMKVKGLKCTFVKVFGVKV